MIVYKVTNIINKKIYLGKSKRSLNKRECSRDLGVDTRTIREGLKNKVKKPYKFIFRYMT